MQDLTNLIAFSLREGPWPDLLGSVPDEYFGPELVKFDLDFDDLEKTIGGHLHWVMWGCAFEDFLKRGWEPEGNVVDRYLKRWGWREPVLCLPYPATHRNGRSSDRCPPYPVAMRLADPLSA